jgi:hypothetical protein
MDNLRECDCIGDRDLFMFRCACGEEHVVEDPGHEFFIREENLYRAKGCVLGVVLEYSRERGAGRFRVVGMERAPLRVAERLSRLFGGWRRGVWVYRPACWMYVSGANHFGWRED